MFVIGITGMMGSGKSEVSKIFKTQGAGVIGCDEIVHELYRKDKLLKAKVRKEFGNGIFKGNEINRKKLAEAVFEDAGKIRKLNSLVHPLAIEEAKKQLGKFRKRKGKLVVIDAPLLFEAGMDAMCDLVVYVECSFKERENRMKKKGVSRNEILKREKFLLPEKEKGKLCDVVVYNGRGLDKAKKQVAALIVKLKGIGVYG